MVAARRKANGRILTAGFSEAPGDAAN
jgi:hypothetical protein